MPTTGVIPRVWAPNPTLGAVLFILGVQYFVVQIVVAARFTGAYSLRLNTISDLGNTSCGVFSGHYVCSPAHLVMNLSFVTLGVCVVAGSVMLRRQFGGSAAVAAGFAMVGVGGAGVVGVGLFAENTVPAIHGIAAALPFLVGNAGIVVLGLAMVAPTAVRACTVATGGLALAALGFYAGGAFLGVGPGGAERMVAYPQTVWQIALGCYLLRALSRPATAPKSPQQAPDPIS